MKIDEIKTPAYICEKEKLVRNLEILKKVSDESGAKILCALKGFAFSLVLDLVDEYLNGATASGLIEAKYAKKFFKKGLIHTYSPAFKDDEIDEILQISDHVSFNSFSQWEKFKDKAIKSGKSFGLRVNPKSSYAPKDIYNPCAKFSRLGITLENFKGDLNCISGLHFHALCEESSENFQKVLNDFEAQFGKFLKNMKWVNFGGGHHITKSGYNIDLLINLLKNFKQKYDLEIFIEPGEAVGWECGYLVSSILDFVENEKTTAILDISAEAHMPDTILMPYRPAVLNEKKDGKFSYRFGGNSCLAGDIVGLETGFDEYKFDEELNIGDKIIFLDQIHYTIVKNTTFNGVKLPDLHLVDKSGEILKSKFFGYDEYERRN